MNRRKKNFLERRQELEGAYEIIDSMLEKFEEQRKISYLRIVASQLRALVVNKPNSNSLKNPLLLSLAEEENFSLTVFTIDPQFTNSYLTELAPHNLEFFSVGDSLSLNKIPPYHYQTTLSQAMELIHIIIGNEKLNMREIVCLVADTEGSHYDPRRPETLDQLDTINLMGLPPEYRTIYSLGKVVRDLCFQFIRRIG